MAINAETSTSPAQAPGPATAPAETHARRIGQLEFIQAALLLVLAFFLGSFAANHYVGEFFLHLSLANPFASVPGPVWPHHAWLPSLIVRQFYVPFTGGSEVGAAVTIVLKALVGVAAAFVLLRIRRPGQSRLVGIGVTTLAIVAMSPRMLLQPSVISLVLVALTILILNLAPERYPHALRYLPALFVLWVNCDGWFVLGPIIVGLWWVGTLLQVRLRMAAACPDQNAKLRLKELGLIFLVGTAACLVNPWTYRAFTLPPELGFMLSPILPAEVAGQGGLIQAIRAVDKDPELLRQDSPFSEELWRSGVSKSVSGLSFFALMAIGLASFLATVFLLKPPKEEGAPKGGNALLTVPLFLVFAAFAAASAMNYRLVHLFAAAAGPIAVLNWQDFMRRRREFAAARAGQVPAEERFHISFHYGALAALAILLICAWPGWLYVWPSRWIASRHVAFSILEDPGIADAARTLARIGDKTGLLKAGFNYTPETGNLFAWNTLQDKSAAQFFCDSRLNLTQDQAADFGKMRLALREEAKLQIRAPANDPLSQARVQKQIVAVKNLFDQLMQKHKLDFVVLTNLQTDAAAAEIALYLFHIQLVAPVPSCFLLYIDGRTAIFGWCGQSVERAEALRPYRLDLEHFVSPLNQPDVAWSGKVPRRPEPSQNPDWDMFLSGPTPPAWSSLQSVQFMSTFESTGTIWQQNPLNALVAYAGGPAANAIRSKGFVLEYKDKDSNVIARAPLIRAADWGPPVAPIFAMRSARNAIASNPDQWEAYRSVGTTALALLEQQEDYWVNRPNVTRAWFDEPYKPQLRRQFRMAQVACAYRDAADLVPDSIALQLQMFDFYKKLLYLDLAFESFVRAKALFELRRWATREDEQISKAYKKEQFEQQAKALKETIDKLGEDYKLLANSAQSPFEQFFVALVDPTKSIKDGNGKEMKQPRGLVGLALKHLDEVQPERLPGDLAKAGYARWRLYLMLTAGFGHDAHKLLVSQETAFRSYMPDGKYEEVRAMAAAAVGDYADADKQLEGAEKAQKLPSDEEIKRSVNARITRIATLGAGFATAIPGPDGPYGATVRTVATMHALLDDVKEPLQSVLQRRYVADLRVIRGLLALESTGIEAAARHFEGALQIAPPNHDFPDAPIARRYLDLFRKR
jgi:hypothetical protein